MIIFAVAVTNVVAAIWTLVNPWLNNCLAACLCYSNPSFSNISATNHITDFKYLYSNCDLQVSPLHGLPPLSLTSRQFQLLGLQPGSPGFTR